MASEGGQGSLAPLDFEIFSKKGCFLSVAVTQERSNATGTCRCKTRKGEKTSAAEDSMLKKITSATASESSLWPNRLARLHHQRLPQSVLPKFEHEKHTMPLVSRISFFRLRFYSNQRNIGSIFAQPILNIWNSDFALTLQCSQHYLRNNFVCWLKNETLPQRISYNSSTVWNQRTPLCLVNNSASHPVPLSEEKILPQRGLQSKA